VPDNRAKILAIATTFDVVMASEDAKTLNQITIILRICKKHDHEFMVGKNNTLATTREAVQCLRDQGVSL